MSYDSTEDTKKHIARVNELLCNAADNLITRGLVHDDSKLESPEKEAFDKYTPMLKSLTYRSEEYKESLKALGVALKHHYENNSHHPEHYEYWECLECGKKYTRKDVPPIGYLSKEEYRWCHCQRVEYPRYFETALHHHKTPVHKMNLFDVIEMLMDWKATGERHADGNIFRSLEINIKRFDISPQLAEILKNNCEYLDWE